MRESICSQYLYMMMSSSEEVDFKIPPTPFAKGGVRGGLCLPLWKTYRVPHFLLDTVGVRC